MLQQMGVSINGTRVGLEERETFSALGGRIFLQPLSALQGAETTQLRKNRAILAQHWEHCIAFVCAGGDKKFTLFLSGRNYSGYLEP